MGNNHSDTKKVFDFLDSDHDGFVTLNQVLHIQKLPQLENWDDCHSPLLLFRFDEGHDGALHYEEFTKLIKHLKASHQQADEPKKRRRWKEKELGKSSENLRLSLSSSGVWTSVDQNSASELDLSRDGKTPMITGRKSHMRPSCSTDDLTEEELNQLVKTEAKEFFGKFIQKSSGRKKFLTWLFHLADADKSNTISGDELKWILNALAHDGILPDNLSFDNNAVLEPTKLVQQIIDEYGTGRSAFLTKEQFMTLADLILKNYQLMSDSGVSHVGKYALKRKLGSGSSGDVWVAVDTSNHLKKVKKAIKVIEKGDVSILSRIDVEIKAMLMLKHPNIVKLEEVLETDEAVFLVEELCSGCELTRYIERKPLSERKANFYFSQLIDAVEYCHTIGVCHRDLKLENCLLDSNANLKITDFGHAGIFTKGWDIFSSGMMGSLYHLSPEQLGGKAYSGERIDIWAMGVLLYRMLVGKPPFFSSNPREFMESIVASRFDVPNTLSPEVKDLFINILRADPEERLSLAQIREHPWCKGPMKHPRIDQLKLRLEYIQEFDIVWKEVKRALEEKDIHFHESNPDSLSLSMSPTLDANTLGILKCIYPRKDLKFSIMFKLSDKEKDPVLFFNHKDGESGIFRRTAVKLKAHLKKALLLRLSTDGQSSDDHPKESMKEKDWKHDSKGGYSSGSDSGRERSGSKRDRSREREREKERERERERDRDQDREDHHSEGTFWNTVTSSVAHAISNF